MFILRANKVESGGSPPLLVASNPSSFSSSSSSSNTTHIATYPTGSVSGSLLIATVWWARGLSGNSTVAAPAGWTRFIENNRSAVGGEQVYQALYWKFRGAETNVTFQASDTSFGQGYAVGMVAYQGSTVNATTPVTGGVFTYSAAASSAAISPPAVTLGSASSELLEISLWSIGSSTTLSTVWAAGITEIMDGTGQITSVPMTVGNSAASTLTNGVYSATPSAVVNRKLVAGMSVNPA